MTKVTPLKLENVGGLMYNTHHNEKEKQMETMLQIGQTFKTTKSGVEGIIKSIEKHPSGVFRVLLDVNGSERWTSVSN